MLQLIDKTKPTIVEIEETNFYINQMTNGERIILTNGLKELDKDESGYDDLLTIVAKYISKIEGHDGDVADILIRIESYDVQLKVIQAVLKTSSVAEDTAKNSQSLSDTQQTED